MDVKEKGKPRNKTFLILSLLGIIYLSYAVATTPPTAPAPNTKTDKDVENLSNLYKIEKVDDLAPIKKTYLIRLNDEISKDHLKNIANEITSNERSKYERIFITYLLPGMKDGHGAWSTTHFNPDLEIKIYGSTYEFKSKLKKNILEENSLGLWDVNGIAIFFEILNKENKWFIKTTYDDGSIVLDKCNKNGDKFILGNNILGDYLIVNDNGNVDLFYKGKKHNFAIKIK